MKLKIKFLKWSAGLPVAMLNEKTAKEMGVHTKDRVSIKTLSKNSKKISTIVDTIADHLVSRKEIAVSSELKNVLNLRDNQKVEVVLAPAQKSLDYIKNKLDGSTFSKKEIEEIIQDVVTNSLSEAEIALFISAMYRQGMNIKETIYLTKAIYESGNHFNLKSKLIADKHSIGGIPGRTTPIIVSICAAAGLTFPKSSSRAITSPSGTADAIETLAKVEFSIKEIKKIIKKTNACIVWGGALGLVPADSKIIKVERQLGIDPEAQLLASIMSKKLAAGSKYLVIHIPYGKGAKVDKKKALKLKRKFEKIAEYFHKKIKVVLTKVSGPIGNGIGPVLEMIDAIKILTRKNPCHKLEEKSLEISGELLELTGKAKKGKGKQLAKKILDDGKAFEKFKKIIEAQKGDVKKIDKLKPAKYKRNILSYRTGKIREIQIKKINSLARLTGCPISKSSGVYLYYHTGDKIKKRQKLLTIYSSSEQRLKEAVKFYKTEKPIKIN